MHSPDNHTQSHPRIITWCPGYPHPTQRTGPLLQGPSSHRAHPDHPAILPQPLPLATSLRWCTVKRPLLLCPTPTPQPRHHKCDPERVQEKVRCPKKKKNTQQLQQEICRESKKCDSWAGGRGGGGSAWQPQCRQAGRCGSPCPPGRSESRAGAMQKLAWLTGPGGVGPGQSRTQWMFCERLLKERQLMAPETEHQKGTDAKPRKAHFTKDGRGPLGSAGRVRTGWLWDPAHPSRLPRSTQEAHESSWADGLDAGGAGSPAGSHCGPQPLPRNPLLHPWILILSPPPTMGRLTAGAGKASSQPPGRPHPTLKKGFWAPPPRPPWPPPLPCVPPEKCRATCGPPPPLPGLPGAARRPRPLPGGPD